MIGGFLEISVGCDDIPASISFYETLGFRQLSTGDLLAHPYAVVSDGRAHIGLHAQPPDSPILTYVLHDLASAVPRLKNSGIQFVSEKLSDYEFNQATFVDPDGQAVCLLEARTFSPASFTEDGFSLLGDFTEFSMPVRDIEIAIRFWEPLGFVAVDRQESSATLASERLNIGVYADARMRGPELCFSVTNIDETLSLVETRGVETSPVRAGRVVISSPEGLAIVLSEAGES